MKWRIVLLTCLSLLPWRAIAACDVSNIDWSKAQTFNVTLDEFYFAFSPETMKACQPYHVVFDNIGFIGHNFVSQELFNTFLVKPENSNIPVKPDYWWVELGPRRYTTLDLVPTTPGSYYALCTHRFHARLGMWAYLTVDPAQPTTP